MPLATLNGAAVLSAHVVLPRVGVWTAELDVDGDASSGAVTLVLGALTLRGTVVRSGSWRGSAQVRVVGGAGRLGAVVPAKAFRLTPLRIPVADTLGAAGEALASSADASLLAAQVPHWVRTAGTASEALTALADAMDASWRVLTDGTVWVGADSYPAANVAAYEVLEESPELARAVLGVDSPDLLPGTTLEVRRVDAVEHVIEPGRVRSIVWWQR